MMDIRARLFGTAAISFSGLDVNYSNVVISNIPVLSRQKIIVTRMKTILIVIIATCSILNSSAQDADMTRIYKAMNKGRNGEDIKIGVIGGSITEGYAASNENNRWANLMADWWKDTFPESNVILINAGWGGTGSDIGAHRLKEDLLVHELDFFVIEFSVNDSEGEQALKMMEGMLQQGLTAQNYPGIMLLMLKRSNGTSAQESHKPVAQHYDVPYVSFADLIDVRLAQDGVAINDIFIDGLHPNDKGMAYISQFIHEKLDSIYSTLPNENQLPEINTQLPDHLVTSVFSSTSQYFTNNIAPVNNQGWEITDTGWSASTPGQQIDFELEGNAISLIFTQDDDASNGRAEVWVDGHPKRVVDCWMNQDWGTRYAYSLIQEELEDGPHVLHIRVVSESSTSGNNIHIERILTADGNNPIRTEFTQQLYDKLLNVQGEGVYFGMHDTTGYGVGWNNDNDRSDIESVIGDYPAFSGWGADYSVAQIARGEGFEDARYKMKLFHDMGGFNTLEWHAQNPYGANYSWENHPDQTINVVEAILPGGEKHQEFLIQLDHLAAFFNTLFDDDGKKIPIIFRPWHEHTGAWFWWGKGNCSEVQYIQLWQFTVDYLSEEKGVNNLLYAYSPDKIDTVEEYLYGYPGDKYIDVLGLDNYGDLRQYATNMPRFVNMLEILVSIANEKNKPAALTETGAFTVDGQATMPEDDWFTQKLLNGIMTNEITRQISYAMVWRNESTSQFHAPYPGHSSVPDFIDFYNDPYTLFMFNAPKVSITTKVNSKSLIFSGADMNLVTKVIFPGDIQVVSSAFTSQTENTIEVALPAGISEGMGDVTVIHSGRRITTENLFFGSLEEVVDPNYVFFDFNGNGKDVFTYGSEIEDMTSSTETSHDDTFFFDANYSFPGSWSWGAGYLFGKSDSDGNPLFFEGIKPSEDVVKFDVYIKNGLPEGLLKIDLGGYYYVWDITSIAPSEGLKTAGWITITCPISEFIQDGTGNVLTDLEEARSRYSMVWTSNAAVDLNISIDNLRFARATLPTDITTTVNSKSLKFNGTSMHLINKIIFPGNIEVASPVFTSQTENTIEVALPAGIPEGMGAAKVVYSGGEIITDNLYYGSLEEVVDANHVFFDFNGNGKDVFTYGSEIEDMTSSTETSHDDTFFFDANYSFSGSWSWGAGYLFGKNDSDGNPLFFEGIDPIEDVVKFDVYIKDGLPEGLLKVGLGNNYFYVWDISSIAPSEGLKTAGWITKTCPISEFVQDGTGNVLTDLEEARSRYSMVWASNAAVDINISIDNLRFASNSGSLSINNLFLNNVVLYPNPFLNTITINASKQADKVVKIEIFSINGVLVDTILADNDITTIDTSNLALGMYFIRLSSNNGNLIVKELIKI
jgi:mannan endo-1,4-beta-mannosidase